MWGSSSGRRCDQTNEECTLDLSRLTDFQRTSLQRALDGLEQPPADVLPASEQFWRGMEAGVRVVAAAEGLDHDAIDWIGNEFLRRLRGVPYIDPAKVRRRQMPILAAGLYHHLGRVTFEVLRDWHASAKRT